MKDWKSLCNKILFPPLRMIIILIIVSTAALVTVFLKGWEKAFFSYGIYVGSFYTLTVICLIVWKKFPTGYKNVKRKVYGNEFANRYLTDKSFQMHMNLYRSLIINLLYVAMNVVSGIIYSTYWFGIFAVYYAIMAVMRFLLLRYVRRNEIGASRLAELKCSRLCAYILMTVNLVLSGVVLMMVYHDRGFEYQGIMIYVMALYTFYMTTTAIIDVIKYRKKSSPVMSITKTIKLAAALFSMLFLETAMFSQFGQDTPLLEKKIMIMATGAGISMIVVSTSVYMIIQTTKEIRKDNKR